MLKERRSLIGMEKYPREEKRERGKRPLRLSFRGGERGEGYFFFKQ